MGFCTIIFLSNFDEKQKGYFKYKMPRGEKSLTEKMKKLLFLA